MTNIEWERGYNARKQLIQMNGQYMYTNNDLSI